MLTRRVAALVLLALVLPVPSARAQALPLPYGPNIGNDQARAVAAAAVAEAKKNGWTVVVAIVDTGGHLVYLERLDQTQVGSVEVAIQKATSANAFKRPTKAFEDALAGGRQTSLRLPGAMPVEGGLPLVLDNRIVGAIGVSGVTSAQDGQIAAAGLAALK